MSHPPSPHLAGTLPVLALSLLDRGPTSSHHLQGELTRMAGSELAPEEARAVVEALVAGGLAAVLMETPRHRYLRIRTEGRAWLRSRVSAWERFRRATMG